MRKARRSLGDGKSLARAIELRAGLIAGAHFEHLQKQVAPHISLLPTLGPQPVEGDPPQSNLALDFEDAPRQRLTTLTLGRVEAGRIVHGAGAPIWSRRALINCGAPRISATGTTPPVAVEMRQALA